MAEFLRLVVAFLAAVNPAAVAVTLGAAEDRSAQRPRWLLPVVAAVGALALLAIAAGVSDRLLDALEIAPESFRLAAGVVLAAVGLEMVVLGRLPFSLNEQTTTAVVLVVGVGMIAGPASLTAAVTYGADQGFGKTFAAAVIAVVVAAALLLARIGRGRPALDVIARVTGALLVAIAAGLATSGVRDI